MHTLSDEEARQLFWGDLDGWEEVESREHDRGRWSYLETKVFKKPCPPDTKGMDEYYGVCFERGATECQEHGGVVKHGPMAAITVQKTEYRWY